MFTLENTEGYDQATLDAMNDELTEAMRNHDHNDDYEQALKNESERIFNKYC